MFRRQHGKPVKAIAFVVSLWIVGCVRRDLDARVGQRILPVASRIITYSNFRIHCDGRLLCGRRGDENCRSQLVER